MNSLNVPLSQEILMLVALVGGKMILLTLQVKKLTFLHLEQDMYKLKINQPML